MRKTAFTLFVILNLAVSAIPLQCIAQDNYPSAPIRLVLGFPPGAGTDATGRLLAQKMSAQMNANIYAENKTGAGGNIAADFVAKARPDGYTLLFNTSAVVVSRAFGEPLGYDLFQDLAPVALVATSPYVLVAHPSVPANNINEFITHIRNNPGKLAYASGGTGNAAHLGTVLFLQANGLQALHVPYKGSGPSMVDLVAGRLQFRLLTPTAAVPMVQDKRLKALAITGLTRSPLLPNVPALNEALMPGFEMGSWFGVLTAAKTPPVIIKRLNFEIVKVLRDPEMRSRLEQDGTEPLGSTPEEYGVYLRKELERWTKVIKSANITPE